METKKTVSTANDNKLDFKKVTIKTGVHAGTKAQPTTTVYHHRPTTTAIVCGPRTTYVTCP